jgi:HisJ family histidinol phosphate phosphatase
VEAPPIDYHIHTVYSGHADPNLSVRSIIERAEQSGLKSIAITEHAFYSLMGRANLEQINREVEAVDTQIEAFVGMEIDPDYAHEGRLIFEDFDKGELFPVLVGVHAYPGTGKGWAESLDLTLSGKRKLYNDWFRLMEKIIENPLVDVLAHPGRLISRNGIVEEFNEHILRDFDDLFTGAKEKGIAIELNEGFLSGCPTERLKKSYLDVIRLGMDKGLKLSLGSDAHRLDKIGEKQLSMGMIEKMKISPGRYYRPVKQL